MKEIIYNGNIGYIAKSYDGGWLIFDSCKFPIDNGHERKSDAMDALISYLS